MLASAPASARLVWPDRAGRSGQRACRAPRVVAAAVRPTADGPDAAAAAVGNAGRRQALLAAGVAALSLCASGAPASAMELKPAKEVLRCVAEIVPTRGSKVAGTVTFVQLVNETGRRSVRIDVDVAGLSPGQHGINVHETGGVRCDEDTAVACTGPSYNPFATPHGAPDSIQKFGASAAHFVGEGAVPWRHVGDLGNLTAGADGRATGSFVDTWIQLTDEGREGYKKNVRGRAVVIHAGADDLQFSKEDGNAGPVVGYGTIA